MVLEVSAASGSDAPPSLSRATAGTLPQLLRRRVPWRADGASGTTPATAPARGVVRHRQLSSRWSGGIVITVRIVVSGTHASGKSTLISDFASRHPEFTVLPDPFELVDEDDAVGPALFAAQLRIAADRLIDEPGRMHVIAERGPLDFLAYLLALADLGNAELDEEFRERAVARTAGALRTVDLLIVLPVTDRDPIHVSADEHLELRAAMNDALLDLLDDPDLIGGHLTVVELAGTPLERLTALETLTGVAGPV